MESRKATNLLPPEARAAAALVSHVGRHPLFYASTAAVLGFSATYGATGWLDSNLSVEGSTTIEIEDAGYGEVVDIDLDIQPRPLIGYTTKVSDAKTAVTRNLHIKAGPLEINPSVGTDTMTWGGLVDAPISYNPDKVSAEYDPGLVNNETDDRFIIKVPLEAFSVQPQILPEGQTADFGSDLWSLPRNFISGWGESVTALKDVPGISNVVDAKNETEQIIIGFTQVNALNNVANTCSPLVASNETVWKAIHARIGSEALLAIGKSSDPDLGKMTLDQIRAIAVIVQIGVESDQPGQELITGQAISTENPYAERLSVIKGLEGVKLESGGEFECELSDEVKEEMANYVDPYAEPTATPAEESSR